MNNINNNIKLVRPTQKEAPAVERLMSNLRGDNNPYNAEFPELIRSTNAYELLAIFESAELPERDRPITFRKKLPTQTYFLYVTFSLVGAIFITPTNSTDEALSVYGNIGYIIDPKERNKGYAYNAVCAALAQYPGDQAIIGAYSTNTSSLKLIKKLVEKRNGSLVSEQEIDAPDFLSQYFSTVRDIYYLIPKKGSSR